MNDYKCPQSTIGKSTDLRTTTSTHHLHKNQPIYIQAPEHHLTQAFTAYKTPNNYISNIQPFSNTAFPSPIPHPELQQTIPRLSPSLLAKPASRARSRKLGTQALSFGLQRSGRAWKANEPPPLATCRAASDHGIGETSVANKCRVQKKERSAEIMEWNGMND